MAHPQESMCYVMVNNNNKNIVGNQWIYSFVFVLVCVYMYVCIYVFILWGVWVGVVVCVCVGVRPAATI